MLLLWGRGDYQRAALILIYGPDGAALIKRWFIFENPLLLEKAWYLRQGGGDIIQCNHCMAMMWWSIFMYLYVYIYIYNIYIYRYIYILYMYIYVYCIYIYIYTYIFISIWKPFNVLYKAKIILKIHIFCKIFRFLSFYIHIYTYINLKAI